MMLKKLSDGLSKNPVVIHLLFWLFFILLFFFAISRVETIEKSLLAVASLFLPMVPGVYLHFLVFNKFFRAKKYLPYFAYLLIIIFAFGFLVKWSTYHLAFPDDENAIVYGELSILTVLVISTFIKLFFEGLVAKSKLAELEFSRSKAELTSLKMQVNPHFLFNSLNNIYGLMLQDNEEAKTSVLTLSGLLRYLSYSANQEKVSLTEEVKFLEDYIRMERLRMGSKSRIQFESSGDFEGRQIPPFLLIPFVENAFKHGAYSTIKESFVEINAAMVQNSLVFEVRNSYQTPKQKKEGGTGIANVKRRLELEMPNAHKLWMSKDESQFYVKLELIL